MQNYQYYRKITTIKLIICYSNHTLQKGSNEKEKRA